MRLSVFMRAMAVSSVVLAGSAQAEETTLDNESISGLFPGHYEARVIGGYRMLIAAEEDGSMMGRAFGREDKGHWEVRENELCVAWLSWTRGKYKCGTITQEGDWFVATNGENGNTMHFRPVEKRDVYAARVGRRIAADR